MIAVSLHWSLLRPVPKPGHAFERLGGVMSAPGGSSTGLLPEGFEYAVQPPATPVGDADASLLPSTSRGVFSAPNQ